MNATPENGFPIIRTKIMIPSVRAGIVHRQTLIEQIEAGIKQGFILVSSPPGYGKTTLLGDWAQQHRHPVAWLSLDNDDNDLLTFNRYLGLFIEKYFKQVQAFSSTLALDSNAEHKYQSYLVTLINGCMEREEEFTLVLDDYQFIQNPVIHRGIAYLLEHFPPHFRLVMITRKDPPIPLTRLLANQKVLMLTANQLQFSIPEVRTFLNETLQLDLSAEEIERFYRQTEGWVAGLQLTALSRNQFTSPYLPDGQVVNYANLSHDYIIEEVYNQQSSDVQEFLLRSSILENLSGPLCDAVIYADDTLQKSQEVLHNLYHSNLFLTNLDHDELWFRYHPLFAECLFAQLKTRYPNELSELYGRASVWYDKNGFYEEALNYALHANMPEVLLDLLEKYAFIVIQQGNILDMFSWIKKADENLIKQSALLSMVYSWGLLMSFDLDSGEGWLNQAKSLLEKSAIHERLLPYEKELWGMIYGIQSMIAAVRGDHENSMQLSQQAINLLPEENSYSHCFALLNQAISYSLNGEINQSIEIVREAMHTSQRTGNWIAMILAYVYMGELFIDQGSLSKALLLFQQAVSFIETLQNKFIGVKGFIYKEIGEIYFLRNELEAADHYLHLGVNLTENWYPSLNKLDSHLRLARLYQAQGDYKKAREQIRAARSYSDISQGELDDLIIDIYEVRLYLLRDQVSFTQRWIQKNGFLDIQDQKITRLPRAVSLPIQLLLMRLYFVRGKRSGKKEEIQQAVQLLTRLLPEIEAVGLLEYRIEAWLIMARAYYELGENDKAISALRTALFLAEAEEFRQVIVDEGIVLARLLTQTMAYIKQAPPDENNPTPAFVADILFRLTGKKINREGDKKPVETNIDLEEAPYAVLTPRETDILKLVAAGKTNKEIAFTYKLSVNTVKRHINNIFVKLGASTRTQAVAVARNHGWIK